MSAPLTWGVRPVLFTLFGLDVPAYGVFVAAGLVAGGLLAAWLGRARPREERRNALIVGFAALFGGALGAKALELLLAAGSFAAVAASDPLAVLVSGRTIIGGFVGGSFAVLLVKRSLGIRQRFGNNLAPAIALGLAVGRLGCFFHGCCHGAPTALPWGVDFGDGLARHPTQLYEAAFALALVPLLLWLRPRVTAPGRLLALFMAAYFVFRFLEEFLRAGAPVALGLTAYQYACLAGLAWFAWREWGGRARSQCEGAVRHAE